MLQRFVAIALGFLIPAEALAHVTWQCDGNTVRWRTGSNAVQMRAGSGTFPDGDPFTFALMAVIAELNLNPSPFRLLLTTLDSSVDVGNGQNEIWGSSDEDLIGGNRGITFTSVDCGDGGIAEADVVINAGVSWTASSSKSTHAIYGGADNDPFDAVMTHELGHAMGLDHEARLYNIMFSLAHHHANGSSARSYLGEDATRGMVFLYGVDSPRRQDVAVSHWKWISVGSPPSPLGHYRTAVFDFDTAGSNDYLIWTEMLDPVDGFLSWRDNTSEPRFPVRSGQTIYPEFTYENNGADTQSVGLDFYLSDDDLVTTGDRRIAGASVTLGADSPFTTVFPVTLPSDLAEGRDYELGVVLDRGGAIAELFHESNNATYVGIRVVPVRPIALSFSQIYVEGGESTEATVTLDGAAPAAGLVLQIVSDDFASAPQTVMVPAGARSTTFQVATSVISGEGYRRTDLSALRSGVGGATGFFYIHRRSGYFPELTFCEGNPDHPICAMCLENPSLPPCETVLGGGG